MISSYLGFPDYGQENTNLDLSRFGSIETISKFFNVVRRIAAEFVSLEEVDTIIEECPEDFLYVMALALEEAERQELKLI